jgi:hypothetical protein
VEVHNTFLNLEDNWTYPKKQNAWKQCIKPFTFSFHIFLISYLFWVIKINKWVHQFELYNLLSTPSAIELCLKIFSSNTYFAKPNTYHNKQNIISKPHISFFVHFGQSLSWWVHEVKVHNTSFKSKDNQDIFEDFELLENLNVQTPTYLPSLQNLKKKTLLNGLYGTC